MGLFDRLFGRKEEAKPQAQDHTEELVESPEEASSLVEPETSKASQSDEAKISAMEAYYAELKERMAAESARSAQESKEVSEEAPTEDANAPDYFFELVQKSGHILAIAPYKKSSQIIANFNNYLDSFFSETISVHGVLVELFGFGVLLTGKSGIGKSETALELIHRGHRLIADDMVKFYRDTQGDIVGKSAELPFFMEIRGLGIIDIKTLYGMSSVRLSKRLDMIIELKALDNSDYMSAPTTHLHEDVLGKPIKKRILEISSGRNAAAMVEVMVMDYMSGLLGQK